MNTVKMTEREILTAVVDGTIDTDILVEYAEKRIAQLDKRNASAKVRAEKKRAAGDEITEKIANMLSDEPMSREDVLNGLVAEGIEDMTLGKVTAKLTKLVKEERAAREKVRTKGEDGKSKEVTVYTAA